MFNFQPTFIAFFISITIILFSILFITICNSIAFSQKIVLPKTYHIQNNSVVVFPFNEEFVKKYESKYENYSIIPSSIKSFQLNNSLSYTITNATVTVIKKITNGITKADILGPNQTIVIPASKVVIGKK